MHGVSLCKICALWGMCVLSGVCLCKVCALWSVCVVSCVFVRFVLCGVYIKFVC